MSEEEAPSGLVIAEKFFGFLIFVVGLLLTYVTYTSFSNLGDIPNVLFFAGSLMLTGLGILIMIAKTE